MPYNEDEAGLLNNFAVEPKVYSSDTDGEKQKKSYLMVAGVGLLLVLGLIAVAFTIS
jgi:hypothetical protein